MTDTTNGQVAAIAAQLLADQQDRDDLFTAWLNGTSDGGPSGDGLYPLPSPTGSVLVPCWAKITDPITGSEENAEASATAAAASQSAVAAIKADIDTIKTYLDARVAEAIALRDEAQARANDAAAEHAAAASERQTCETIQTAIQVLYDEWSAAQST